MNTMRESSIYGAFNARWITPENVARFLIPTPHLNALVKFQNSLLMGPRGCGKTTLLKMLTRGAQEVWRKERVAADPELAKYELPDFEAIYIPSDVRWSYELRALGDEISDDPVLAERVQRASVAITSLIEAITLFEALLKDSKQAMTALAVQLIRHFDLEGIVPIFSDIRLALKSFSEGIRHAKNLRDTELVRSQVSGMPPVFTAHSLDTLDKACSIFQEYAPSRVQPTRWAFCFDEIEIAPRWLQSELLNAFRSSHQAYLLKLTWSPVLPLDLMSKEEKHQDYATIRMWHSHYVDARVFCQEFCSKRIRERLKQPFSPRMVFGPSLFAQEEMVGEENDVYGPNSEVWNAMVDLAKWDQSFHDYLLNEGLDPANPVSDNIRKRDECLRKIKPIALLRDFYLKDSGKERRSRKVHTLYWGEETIYAMSEGNPRLLAGLVDDLLDSTVHKEASEKPTQPLMPPAAQSKVLNAASSRMESFIKAYPTLSGRPRTLHLAKLVQMLGDYLRTQLLGPHFHADPIGSFVVDEKVSADIVEEIGRGLLIGAFIFVGRTASDVPNSIAGSRIRLTHMLAPRHQLLLRNFRQMRLSAALRQVSPGQLEMPT